MIERDRPIAERVSVLERPITEHDVLPPHMGPHRPDLIQPGSARLAAVDGEIRLYVARGTDEETLVDLACDPSGTSASAGPRSTLVSHGARIGWSSGGGLSYAHGIVPDTVIAVRVGDAYAVLGENGFIARSTTRRDPIVLVTVDGERTVERPSFPRIGNPDASSPDQPGYVGYVEYAQRGVARVEIDDLDDPRWAFTFSSFVMTTDTPDVWTVGVVLLEGHRAGELAIADLVVQRDDAHDVVTVALEGRSAFGPHPEPQRLPAALERFRDM